MGIIKKILANPVVKMLVSSRIIKTILLILIIAAPLFLLFRWLKKRRQKKAGGAVEPQLGAADLLKIYKKFKRQIPGEFRRAISFYQLFVVLGEAGSGKSKLIDNYTDWQGQACQFYPSFTADPLLQFYLGSQELVQEVSPSLLRDSSHQARKALIKLWKPMFHKKAPTVICVLNAAALTALPPEALHKQAQLMRGKINIISRIIHRPVTVHVVMTHMDRIDGFLAFQDLLEQAGIDLQISLDEASIKHLKTCLVPYEKYLPLALTTLSSRDYLAIMTFLTNAPKLLATLVLFLNSLREAGPLSHIPLTTSLFMVSNIAREGLDTTRQGATLALIDQSP